MKKFIDIYYEEIISALSKEDRANMPDYRELEMMWDHHINSADIVGIIENRVDRELSSGHIFAPALLLDLDGTVRRSKTGGFIKNLDDIELMPGIDDLIWSYRFRGWKIIGVSNQGGVAYGFKTQDDVLAEHSAMTGLFADNPFHQIYHSFSMEKGSVEPYCHRSLMRKPSIGMLALAEHDFNQKGVILDWDSSLFVGNQDEDRDCAKNADVTYMDINDFLAKTDHHTQ